MSVTITGISSMATRNMLAELARDYELISGQRIMFESAGGVTASQRVRDGEAFDIVVLAADAIDRLSTAQCVDAATRVDLARSGIALAVRHGAPRPCITSEASVRDALLGARSIGYSTGPSGSHLMDLFERWGIAAIVAPRIVRAPPGIPVGSLVARGEVEVGLQQQSELMHMPGIDVVGLLPAGIQRTTVFSAALCARSTQREAAKALLAFLASDRAALAKSRHGMEPV